MSFESENTTPSIILCVFPHLEKILLLNSIDSTKNIITLNSKIMFNDDFYDSIESKFSEEIRSGRFSILSPNGVPEKIETILRDETISRIMDSIKDEFGYFEEISQELISIFFFSGQVLSFNKKELMSAISIIYKDRFSKDSLEEMSETLFQLSLKEKNIIDKSKNNDLYDLITGQQGEFATIWDKDSIT